MVVKKTGDYSYEWDLSKPSRVAQARKASPNNTTHKKNSHKAKKPTQESSIESLINWADNAGPKIRTATMVGLAAYGAFFITPKLYQANAHESNRTSITAIDENAKSDAKSTYTLGNTDKILNELKKGNMTPSMNSSNYIATNTFSKPLKNVMRFDHIARKLEKKYSIQEGLLSGLGMREGKGNPIALNSGNDGGAGEYMFQPGMAQHYGLKTFGDSKRTGRDTKHGKRMDSLVKANNYDHEKLKKFDDRFDVEKSMDAAAQYLVSEHKKHGTWGRAVSAYNNGGVIKSFLNSRHNHFIREYQRQVLQSRKNKGIKVDESLLSELNEITAYKFQKKNDNKYAHIALVGDTPKKIANRFNKMYDATIDSNNLYTKKGVALNMNNIKAETTIYIKK